jgi:hypothetical protein
MAYIESTPFDYEAETVADASTLPNMFKIVRGIETCKIVNEILMSTNLVVSLRIGDRPYRVLRVTPQTEGKIRVTLVGTYSVVVPWFTKFDFCLGIDIQEFDRGLKDGKMWEHSKETGPIS